MSCTRKRQTKYRLLFKPTVFRSGAVATSPRTKRKKEIPAYVSECEITLIDLSLPAIICRKKFENTKLADEISSRSVYWDEIKRKNKVVAPAAAGRDQRFPARPAAQDVTEAGQSAR